MSNEFSFSDECLKANEEWVDKEYAAQLLEDTKTLVMAQRQAALGEMAVNMKL
jgi:hypothetical protein